MATTKLDKEPKDPAYRRFVPDQVLTASQLNDVIDHFECQDRFTRICLNGVGIACGLEIKYAKNSSIEVTKGCAVTTDGDLIPFSGATYTQVKTFNDVEAKYSRFNGINLIELLTDDTTEESNVEPLSTVEDLETMVVVLYLEYFCKEETPCTSTDCDTQGEGQSAKIRLLLIPKENAKRISNKDNDPIFDAHNNTKKFIDLPDVNLKRVILKNSYFTRNRVQVISQNSNTASYFRLKDSYRKAIQDTSVIADLKSGISKLFTDFKVLLDTGSIETKASTINTKITALFKLTSRNLPLDIQYRYDLLKDLIDTYNDIKCLLFDLRVVCCPDISSFPKHLFLGELEPVETFFQCRHKFYPSPIIPHGKEKFEEIRTLILRIHFMLSDYKIPQSSAPIKVTPSKVPSKELGKRALPYYYKTSSDLIKNWDYDKTKKFKSDENLGYQSANLSESDAIQNPLDYDLDAHDFYRIEGHLGKDYRDAIKDLDTIKTDKGLAFDIKVLSIDETIESIDPNDYECEFEDINAVLRAWRAEQNCLNAGVSKFFSGFSLKKQGEHKFYKLSKLANITADTSRPSESTETAPPRPSTTGTGPGISVAPITPVFSGSTRSLLASDSRFFDTKSAIDTKAIFKAIPGLKLYNIDTVVLDNLEKDEDVLGSIVEKAMREKPEGSAEDIVNLVKRNIDQDPEISTWDADNREVAMYNAAEILSYTKVASRFIPNDITEIDPDRIDKYDQTIKDLCSRVERFKKNMTTLLYKPETTYKRIGHEQQYALLLNQLSVNCCSAAKMKSLLAEIEIRKKKILEQKLLSKFVEKHAGLEHKAGVKPGGTFVLVYKGGIRKAQPIFPLNPSFGNVLSDALINPNIGTIGRNPIANISAIKTSGRTLAKDTIATRNIDFAEIDPRISDNLNLENLINPNILDALGDRFILPPFSNISENTVVADFTLPYICCSDCSPIAFIVPKTPTSLRLPVDFVCLDDKTEKIAFEVSPSDGVVAADVAEGLNGGVIQEDGKYMFDANAVSEELYGKEIKFTVNDQFTDASITVFKKPKFTIVASEPRFFNKNTIATVNFTVNYTELPVDTYTYEWDFGDNSLSENENPTHKYHLNLGDGGKNAFAVSLTITNGRCSHTENLDLQIDVVVEEKACIDESKVILERGLKELAEIGNTDISDDVRKNAIAPTTELHQKITGELKKFVEGSFNSELPNIFTKLLQNTAGQILERKDEQGKPEFIALANTFRLQIQALYSVLCCQSENRIKEFSNSINSVLTEIDKALQQFKKDKIDVDREGKLKEFLKALLKKVSGLELLQRHIKIQMEQLK
ncbi:PKD domain-containing protein [Algibacter sp. 2305UL17-15]|uniref:PKD domain-containing protein n=1 Tax=Algibacter sp. 2305UL17-15 TaxID=3231268 RepID=UPI0034597CEB